jgi:hypothetical protein
VIVLAGMIAGLVLEHVRQAMVAAGLAIAAAILLAIEVIVIAPQKASDVRLEGVHDASFLRATPAYGFWLTIFVLVGLALWQIFGVLKPARSAHASDVSHPITPPAP